MWNLHSLERDLYKTLFSNITHLSISNDEDRVKCYLFIIIEIDCNMINKLIYLCLSMHMLYHDGHILMSKILWNYIAKYKGVANINVMKIKDLMM